MEKSTPIRTVHLYAVCQNCEWMDGDQSKAAKRGSKHAEKTGHRVHIERGQSWTYN